MPFLRLATKWKARNHVFSGKGDCSKIVPTLMEKRFRQAPHLYFFP